MMGFFDRELHFMGRWLAIAGFFGTALYLGLAVLLMNEKLSDLADMPLNEIGDFLAGVFSPLAFLWLVLGFLQQGRELKASTDALTLQAEELRASVLQQEELVRVSRQQHEEEVKARQAERQRNEIQAQPVLDIEKGPMSFSSGLITGRFALRNTGHQVTRVRLRWKSSAGVSLREQISVLPNGASVPFDITASPADIQNFLMHIDYIDGINQPRQKSFLFTRLENSSFPRFDVEAVHGTVIEA